MDHFKRYFILVIALVIFGCAEERPEQAPPPEPPVKTDPGSTEPAKEDAHGYTISVTSKSEFVYAYYSVQTPFPVKAERFFRLDKGECFRVKGDQFANVSIFTSRGTAASFFRDSRGQSISAETLIRERNKYMPLCNPLFECNPNNYSIAPRDTGIMDTASAEQFVMLPVKIEVFKDQCDYFFKIDKWMEFKVKQYVIGVEASQGNVDPILQKQLNEWIVSQ